MCRVIKLDSQNHFFDFVHTQIEHRRKGFCTSLLYFVLSRLPSNPELDIRIQATVMKRIASFYGYRKVGVSDRFRHCERWVRTGFHNGFTPWYDARILRKTCYQSKHRSTTVLYLAMESKRFAEHLSKQLTGTGCN
jgi:hypothetical protein